MTGIENFTSFVKLEEINKGWSGDLKYRIDTANGEKLLLRIANIVEHERKKMEYGMMERAAFLDINMPSPVDFGACGGGTNVYSLLTWCEGEDVDALLPSLSDNEKYNLGIKAGELLRKLHSLSAPESAEPWGDWFRRKVNGRIDFYRSHPIQSERAEILVNYLIDNQNRLDGRPQTFNHGDFNTTNLIATPEGDVGVIDFNGYNRDCGDPWWEFCSVAWGQEADSYYMTGLFDGYFRKTPPQDFFFMQAYYFAYDALASLCSTAEYDGGEPEEGQRHVENVLRWFDDMKKTIPIWYLSERKVDAL